MTSLTSLKKPDIKISVKQTFGLDTEMEIEAFSKTNEFVPKIDQNYKFDRDTTLAILSGFAFNKRVLVQGYHGTGKSTHIEQVAFHEQCSISCSRRRWQWLCLSSFRTRRASGPFPRGAMPHMWWLPRRRVQLSHRDR